MRRTKTKTKTKWAVRDATGEDHPVDTRAEAREYAKLWDRDCPDEAPHRVVRVKEPT